ncbi:MAG: PKD domain-containing protein [Paludibacteraceae bacterium]|nr:PKD domain-containing protein [Paludibacteraceae bacterium]
MKRSICILSVGLLFSLQACREHRITEETFPLPTIDFTYQVADNTYQLDYYVGATIKFYPTVSLASDCVWDFGDGTPQVTGDTVYHKYEQFGNFRVTAKANGGEKSNMIMISDIKPIVTIVSDDSICEVKTSLVSFEVELPNPDNLDAIFQWTFPAGTTNENNESVDTYEGRDPGRVKFSRVGSQTVRLQVLMGHADANEWRALETVKKNVQVALDVEAPTLYYAVKEGNLMALKLYDGTAAGIAIDPYDLGVSSGSHPFNLLFKGESLYVLDAGQQFNYVNDENGVLGDGKITVIAKDASSIETMITNVGGPAFQDPFYGCIVGQELFYSDRNTGVINIPLSTRNETWSSSKFPYYIQNNYLGYYGRGLSYGAITGCLAQVKGLWYWAKTYNGNGIWRFADNERLDHAVTDADPVPAAGPLLEGSQCKAFVYDEQRDRLFYTIYDMNAGIYASTIEQVEAAGDASAVAGYMLKFGDGKIVEPIVEAGKGEGSSGEFIGICQLALDEATGDVYFGYRSGNEVKSGLVRYNATTGNLQHVIDDVLIYGVVINNTPSKLF